jgi:hypothetical protein
MNIEVYNRLTYAPIFARINEISRLCISRDHLCFMSKIIGGQSDNMKQRRVSVEDYRKLVAMQARKAWCRLPMQTRMWIDIEDMIEDGMFQAWKLSKTFNPQWASFPTALYHRTHKFFINEYLEFHSAYKRGWTEIKNGDNVKKTDKRYGHKRALEFQSMEALTNDKSYDEVGAFPALVTSPDSIMNNVLTECFVISAMENIYKEASPRLQRAMVEWFLSTDHTRYHTKGAKFKRRASEFRELCKHEKLTCNDCIHLVRSPSCLDTLNRNLFHVPRSLDYPCPAAERML